MIDPTTGEQTEINERGPQVTEQEVELFVDKLLYLAKGASMCVFAGSLPRDVDADVYARLIRELRRLGVDDVVDTDGDPLRRAVRAEPDVISPNVLEAEELVGHEFNDDEDRVHRRARDGRARRARGDHDHARRLLRADARPRSRRRRADALPRAGARRARSSRAPRSAPATPSWPASSPPATTAARPSRLPRLRRRLRRRVDPAPRGRARRPRAGRAAAVGDRGRAPGTACGSRLIFRRFITRGRRLAWTVHLPSAAKPRIPSWK